MLVTCFPGLVRDPRLARERIIELEKAQIKTSVQSAEFPRDDSE
jgi:hypothetical protein